MIINKGRTHGEVWFERTRLENEDLMLAIDKKGIYRVTAQDNDYNSIYHKEKYNENTRYK
jgi:hypothetical protein